MRRETLFYIFWQFGNFPPRLPEFNWIQNINWDNSKIYSSPWKLQFIQKFFFQKMFLKILIRIFKKRYNHRPGYCCVCESFLNKIVWKFEPEFFNNFFKNLNQNCQKTSQELQTLSPVTLNCQETMIVMN